MFYKGGRTFIFIFIFRAFNRLTIRTFIRKRNNNIQFIYSLYTVSAVRVTTEQVSIYEMLHNVKNYFF